MNKLNQTTESRDRAMDFLKGIGIIYVVLGHTLVNPLHNFIYLFHMPLFYFISGYFYNDKYSDQPVNLIKSRIRTLYIPFIKYEIIFLLLHNIFFRMNLYSDKVSYNGITGKMYNIHDYANHLFHIITFGNKEQLLGAFWFLTVLFTINIIFCLSRFIYLKIARNNSDVFFGLIILIMYIAGNLLKYYNISLPRQIEVSLMAIIFFYTGFLYNKYRSHISLNKWFAVLCLIILCAGTRYSDNTFMKSLMVFPFLSLFFGLCGIYINIFVSNIELVKNNSIINIIGKNTIVIMALHFLSFKVVNLIQVKYYSYPLYMIASFPVIDGYNGWWIAYFFAGISLPLLCITVYNSFKEQIKKIIQMGQDI